MINAETTNERMNNAEVSNKRMINAGDFFCVNCGSITTSAYYKNATKKTGILLKHKIKHGKYHYVPFPCEVGTNKEPAQRPTILVKTDLSNNVPGVPRSIRVMLPDVEGSVEMHRACQNCGTLAPVICPDIGKYPTYIILMAGRIQVGKSRWLETLCVPGRLFELNNSYNYPVLISSTVPHKDTNEAVEPTVPGDYGETVCLELRDRYARKEEPFANVILLDISGEELDKLAMEDARARDLLKHIAAIIFFEGEMTSEFQKQDIDIYTKVQNVFGTTNLHNIPMACVRTHLDKIVANKASVTRDGMPLVSKKTFRDQTYHPKSRAQRFLIEHYIGVQLGSVALGGIARKDRHCFLIQSCTSQINEDKKTSSSDYKNTTNALDPLLWILNQLKLFPLDYRKKGGLQSGENSV